PTVAGLATTFGSGAMTNSIGEIDDAGTIFVIGSNTTAAHPVISHRMRRAARNGATLIVVNPKEIDLTRSADYFLQPKPGSDTALLMGMCRYIVENDLQDKKFIKDNTENFEEFQKSFEPFTPEFVEEITGVPWEQIALVARVYATIKPASIFYAMGITQHSHGTDNVMAVANLAMLTGSVGKPSTGVNPLRGQNNVQGSCDLGGLPNVYPGYQRVDDKEVQEKFEQAWGRKLSGEVGLTHTEIFDAILDGKIKSLYLVGENPVLTEANAKHARKALDEVDFLVSQDIFLSESAQYADVVLPAASFAEKNGTFTNTERRVQRVRQVIPPRGDSKADWQIVAEIAQAMGEAGFDYNSSEDIMDEINEVTPIYGGITYKRIDEVGLQWPCRDEKDPGTKFLHQGKFSRGKGHFVPLTYKLSAEIADKKYPLILTTDRSLYHYHSSTMTRRVKGLEELASEELIKLNPIDAELYGVNDGQWVEISSRRGTIKARVEVTDICRPGMCSMTFHFFEAPTNEITNPALDPIAKIPETKVSAVKITPVTE
ncbi:MAG: molybdopterin-dependent oxidoreductase, partial [Chloroflexi bacterium]|nr:molybdopterin-dependent oxidoreductase [Chloroflexota bacterium]